MKRFFEILGDVCGVIVLFGGLWAAMLIGHAMGW